MGGDFASSLRYFKAIFPITACAVAPAESPVVENAVTALSIIAAQFTRQSHFANPSTD
ncbi:MAG: hypothetical protein ACI4JZ_02520 [Oscillospiraceae bacterium]